MNEKSDLKSPNLGLIEFSDHEKAKIGAALQALADQIEQTSDNKDAVDDESNILCTRLEGGVARNEIAKPSCQTDLSEDHLLPTNYLLPYLSANITEPQIHEYEIEPPLDKSNTLSAGTEDLAKHKNTKNITNSLELDQEDCGLEYDPSIYYRFIHQVCPVCGQDCGTLSRLVLHCQTLHKSNTFDCLNINKVTYKAGKSYYQCRNCNRKFSYNVNLIDLQNHHKTHLHYKDIFKCMLCEKLFKGRSNVCLHIKLHHTDSVLKGHSNMSYIKITCPICQQPQSDVKCWGIHLNKKHDYEQKIKSHIVPRYKHQEQCFDTSIRNLFLKHEKHKSFNCTLCEEQFIYPNEAFKHGGMCKKQSCHTCKYCGAKFATSALNWHHHRVHHRKQIGKCSVCNKEFLDLLQHRKTCDHNIKQRNNKLRNKNN